MDLGNPSALTSSYLCSAPSLLVTFPTTQINTPMPLRAGQNSNISAGILEPTAKRQRLRDQGPHQAKKREGKSGVNEESSTDIYTMCKIDSW